MYNCVKIWKVSYVKIDKKLSEVSSMENSTQTSLGVLIGGVHTYFPKEIIRGISKEAEKENVNIFYFLGMQTKVFLKQALGEQSNAFYDYQFNTIYDYCRIAGVKGVIINYGTIGTYFKEGNSTAFARRYNDLPVVLLTDKVDLPNCYSIISDNYQGLHTAVEHLIEEHRCRKILFVNGPEGNTDAHERFQGYLDAMSAHGLRVEPKMIAPGDYSEFIDANVERLLDENPDADAIAFANDEMAFSGCRVCKRRGLRVGKDIFITGYDNSELSLRTDPPLTTVLQDGRSMGKLAVQNMLRILNGEEVPFCRYPTRLVVRESCGCRGKKPKEEEKNSFNEEGAAEEIQRLRHEIAEKQQEFIDFQRNSWLIPLMVRELNETVDDERGFCLRIMDAMKTLGVPSSYLFLLDQPINYNGEDEWVCPDNLRLAAYCRKEQTYAYSLLERPLVTEENGIAHMTDDGETHQFMVYLLFSGERQYGLLVCDVPVKDLSFYYVVSLQIGLALHNYELNKIEALHRQQMFQDMERIREKNRELDMKSAYDQLTGLLNLRGFTERANKLCEEGESRKAHLLYGDLDHLKEINDTWGHAEGNFAIRSCADILKSCIRGSDMIARIGGDEFSCLVFSEKEGFENILKNRIVEACKQFNETSGKPYYVEISVGIKTFQMKCYEDLHLATISADQDLYEAKKTRKKSIKKKNNEL